MGNTAVEDEDVAKLAIGARGMRRQRLSRVRLARLLGSKLEAEDDLDEGEEASGEDSDEEGVQLARRLVGSRWLRRKRARRMLLAHLLRDRSEAEGDEDIDDESAEGDQDQDTKLVRAVIGSRILRRKRARKMVLAHLLRERSEAGDEDEDIDDESAEGDDDTRLVKAVIASRILRRKRARKMILAHLLRARSEAGEEDEDEDIDDESAEGDDDTRLAKAVIGSRLMRRGRARKMLLAHLLRERRDEAA